MKKILFIIIIVVIVVAGLFLISKKMQHFNKSNSSNENEQTNENSIVKVGDIILSDGSIVKSEDCTKVNEDNLPVAIVSGFNEDGSTFAIGLHISNETREWATDDSMGYSTNFKELIAKQTNNEKNTFSGKLNGKDSLESILSIEKEDSQDLEHNYPVFHFANTYGLEYGLLGDYSEGWYVPSIAELSIIYRNRESINASLQKLYKLDNNLATNGLSTNWYWSSSQAEKQNDYAWFVHFVNGYAGECPKNFTNLHTLVIHEYLGDKK